MLDMNAILLSDSYKQVHRRMYSKDLSKLVSYWVPRKSMLKSQDTMVFFGLQAFLQEFLIDYFDRNFFKKEINGLISEYQKYMDIQLGRGNYDVEPIIKLHDLGYLPILIRAIPEGTSVQMGIPCIELTNTDPEFAWVVQWVECILQAELWKTCNHATIGQMYLKLAKKYYDKSVVNGDYRMAMSDFGMRGMSCMNEAARCSAAWLLSFNKTSSIPALPYIEKYYGADVTHDKIGIGAVSTEHSVISSHYAEDKDEAVFLKKMLVELYPNTSFSFLGDTYDYWNFIDDVIPRCKKEIMKHNGKLLIRPDSGDQVEITVKTVQKLWDIFGGTENIKGYKVLDSHIGVMLGDGCTLRTVDRIWSKLDELGFAANNVVFGVGAFCFSAIFDNEKMIVNTRDTFGVAMKSTYAEFGNPDEVEVKKMFLYKDPKTDTSNLKKSHKGICHVIYDSTGKLSCSDQHDSLCNEDESALKTVFEDGVIYNKQNFTSIRNLVESF